MTDTSDAVADRYRRLLMARSGVERLTMGCDMFDTARRVARASFAASEPTAIRVALFLRCYGADFDDSRRNRIVAFLRRRG